MPGDRKPFWYIFALVLIRSILATFTRATWRGMEHVPADGGVIIAANHIGHADPMTCALFVHNSGRWPRFMGKKELWSVPGFGRILRSTRQIPVDRKADAAASLGPATDAILDGGALVIYPEGTITKDPRKWPMVARTGVARLALTTKVPVVPVAQWGPQHMRPRVFRGRLVPRTPVTVMAGPPVDLSRWHDQEVTAEVLSEATAEIMSAVRDLVGELRGEVPPPDVFDLRAHLLAQGDTVERRSA